MDVLRSCGQGKLSGRAKAEAIPNCDRHHLPSCSAVQMGFRTRGLDELEPEIKFVLAGGSCGLRDLEMLRANAHGYGGILSDLELRWQPEPR